MSNSLYKVEIRKPVALVQSFEQNYEFLCFTLLLEIFYSCIKIPARLDLNVFALPSASF